MCMLNLHNEIIAVHIEVVFEAIMFCTNFLSVTYPLPMSGKQQNDLRLVHIVHNFIMIDSSIDYKMDL